jgi:hypothetical protein
LVKTMAALSSRRLRGRLRPDILRAIPEADLSHKPGAVADRHLEATGHEAQQHLLPGLGALAYATLHID